MLCVDFFEHELLLLIELELLDLKLDVLHVHVVLLDSSVIEQCPTQILAHFSEVKGVEMIVYLVWIWLPVPVWLVFHWLWTAE